MDLTNVARLNLTEAHAVDEVQVRWAGAYASYSGGEGEYA